MANGPNIFQMLLVSFSYSILELFTNMQKGSRSDPNNYQPISVLPILGRTLEKLVPAQLYNFCELNAIIPKQQFGFRRHSSCEMALLSATDSWLDALDKGSYVGVLLISLSKAFDTVPHLLLPDPCGNPRETIATE